MKHILFCALLFVSLLSPVFAAAKLEGLGDDEHSRLLYNIILDIGIQDREAYVEIMKNLFNGNKIGSGIVGAPDASGLVQYSANISIKDKNSNIIFDRLFNGAFKSDFSDISKQPIEIKPYITQEAFDEIKRKAKQKNNKSQ